MPLRFAHAGDFHLDEDRYFADTAQCLEWFGADAIQASVDFFVINGDLTTYKATIKERNFWVDMLVEIANHSPVILAAGNHGAELEGDLYGLGNGSPPRGEYCARMSSSCFASAGGVARPSIRISLGS